jgi:hypothetical protein
MMTGISTHPVAQAKNTAKRTSRPLQELLLQAALLQDQAALEAWQEWRSQADIETLDAASYHLLSLLYPNLVRYGVEDSHLGRLKGVYRRAWYANQLLLKSFKLVLQALQAAQVNPLVLGEIALVSTCYADYGQRPIYQFDVMVPRSQTQDAIATLVELGWSTHSSRPPSGERLWKPMLFWNTDTAERNPNVSLNLYNYFFQAEPQSFTDQQLWTNAVVTQIHDLSAPVLSPVDQLLHLCLMSNERQQQQPIYWFADAVMLINTMTQEADWVRLVTQAQRYEIIIPLRYLLTDLQAVLPLTIPNWVLPSLNKMAISYHELLNYKLLPDNKLLLLKSQLVHLRQQWRGLFTSPRA